MAFYANALNITPKYLSEVLQSELGKAAKTFIDEYVVMEAKSLLKQTSLSIQEICYWLGFEDASHFNKSFKKLTNRRLPSRIISSTAICTISADILPNTACLRRTTFVLSH